MTNRITYIALLIAILFCLPAKAQQKQSVNKPANKNNRQQLLQYIEALKNDNDLKSASWSLSIIDGGTGQTITSYRQNANLVPASILKLVTTGVGALLFTNNYRFTTTLGYMGYIDTDSVLQGNLYLIGGGDPTFGSTQFKGTAADSIFNYFTQSIKKAGIKRINGKLIADVSLFDDIEIHDTWEWGDIGNYYGAGTSALSFCENMFTIAIKPAKQIKQSATLGSPSPLLADATIRNMATTSHRDSSVTINIFTSPMLAEYWIRGTVPMGKDSIIAKGGIQKPALVCLNNFDTYLNKNNITTSRQFDLKTDTTSIKLDAPLCVWTSPSYTEIADNTNRYSNNVFAETIFKHIALQRAKVKQGSYNASVNDVISILNERGVDTKGISLNDGSGLSRHNLISTDFMCRFLLMMYKNYPKFSTIMPMPGEKGTLSGFMYAYPKNRNKVRLKSGSMTGVLNYAGYIQNKDGNTWCVSIMTNNFTCKVSQMRPKLEKLVYLITESE